MLNIIVDCINAKIPLELNIPRLCCPHNLGMFKVPWGFAHISSAIAQQLFCVFRAAKGGFAAYLPLPQQLCHGLLH